LRIKRESPLEQPPAPGCSGPERRDPPACAEYADSTPEFTRVIDRSQDTLEREAGWELKNGTTVESEVAYGYDITGRLSSVTSPAGTSSYAYQANSMGLLHTVTGPAHTVTNIWDATRDYLTKKENKVGTTVISAYDYSVNSLGQRTEVAKTGSAFASNRSIASGYDALGQLIKADSSITGFDRAYEFDGIGNRKKSAENVTTRQPMALACQPT
jgi:YD repeat-containing protein